MSFAVKVILTHQMFLPRNYFWVKIVLATKNKSYGLKEAFREKSFVSKVLTILKMYLFEILEESCVGAALLIFP